MDAMLKGQPKHEVHRAKRPVRAKKEAAAASAA
jgi:hypothetical protein